MFCLSSNYMRDFTSRLTNTLSLKLYEIYKHLSLIYMLSKCRDKVDKSLSIACFHFRGLKATVKSPEFQKIIVLLSKIKLLFWHLCLFFYRELFIGILLKISNMVSPKMKLQVIYKKKVELGLSRTMWHVMRFDNLTLMHMVYISSIHKEKH
jgi:hypothetical protein